MAVPKFDELFKPFLEFASDGEVHSVSDAREEIAKRLNLTEDDLSEMISNGRVSKFAAFLGWVKAYLKQAELIEDVKRGHFKVTQRGLDVLRENPRPFDSKYLMKFEEFRRFQNRKKQATDDKGDASSNGISVQVSPEEQIESAFSEIKDKLSDELLVTVKSCSSAFFERLIVDVLIAMGYGGSRKEAGQSVGKSGDGGIDGIIKEDRLGLENIYLQAKRWEGSVGSPEIHKFVGALHGKQATKGVFVTTSNFTREAMEYAKAIGTNVILIDGEKLTDYMIEFNVGVSHVMRYEIKRVDNDYFDEEL